jgi:hypothetical protein
MSDFAEKLFEKHPVFKEKSLSKRRFKQSHVLPLIQKLPFEKLVVGKSFENREIIKLTVGSGPINILLWSQMHGNEATATMAMFDIFNFFNSDDKEFDSYKNQILKKLTLHFIPMLNPDGAERFQRRTAQEIDMNRDALALQCPESKILKNMVGELKPEVSFNLHDQNTLYSAGQTPFQATISFLATAYNEDREWNPIRIRSRQLICAMTSVLKNYIPNGIGRFSDEFEPRAFGDNIQKWGSSLILVESGGYQNDTEKQFIRKLNFVAILEALYLLSIEEDYDKYSLADYESIPQNSRNLFDLKIINAYIDINKKRFKIDVGINMEEINNSKATTFTNSSVIEDLGDLSVFYGIKTIDAKGATLKPLNQFPELLKKYNLKGKYPDKIITGQKASFVIDYSESQTIVVNGKILD